MYTYANTSTVHTHVKHTQYVNTSTLHTTVKHTICKHVNCTQDNKTHTICEHANCEQPCQTHTICEHLHAAHICEANTLITVTSCGIRSMEIFQDETHLLEVSSSPTHSMWCELKKLHQLSH